MVFIPLSRLIVLVLLARGLPFGKLRNLTYINLYKRRSSDIF